jgi:hypothetical protein
MFNVAVMSLGYKTSLLMLYGEIVTDCAEIRTKHTNALYGRNVEILDIKWSCKQVNV